MTKPLAIPADPAAREALILELAAALQERQAEVESLYAKLAAQQLQIAELLQRAFRQRSERYLENPAQLQLDFGDSPQIADAVEGLQDAQQTAADEPPEVSEIVIQEHTRRQRQPRDEKLPPHLPREVVEVEPTGELKAQVERGELTLIGYDEVETLMFEPARLWVQVKRYPKFAKANEPALGVASPPRAAGLVEGSKYDVSVAAQIICGKYGFHLPIYRQQDYFAGSGWTPARSTLLNILQASAELVRPFTQWLADEVRRDAVLGTDETRVTLLLPPALPSGDTIKSQRIREVFAEARRAGKPSVSGRMWAYRGVTVPVNVFDFTVSRHRDGPDAFLVETNYTGKLLADCYSGYQGIALRSGARIERAACNAHARRKIFEARQTRPLLASQFLAIYQELYDLEDRARRMPPAERQALRQEEAQPLWARMAELLESPAAKQLLPKESFAQALSYLRNQWDALQAYLRDGLLPIDNNEVEQLMKQVAVGRKNWLFIGSVAAGERAADLITLVSSALRNDLDVWSYLCDVLRRLLAGETDYAPLRPDRWAAAHPDQIRRYRQDERRQTADRKQHRRALRRQQ
jgi:transposase